MRCDTPYPTQIVGFLYKPKCVTGHIPYRLNEYCFAPRFLSRVTDASVGRQIQFALSSSHHVGRRNGRPTRRWSVQTFNVSHNSSDGSHNIQETRLVLPSIPTKIQRRNALCERIIGHCSNQLEVSGTTCSMIYDATTFS